MEVQLNVVTKDLQSLGYSSAGPQATGEAVLTSLSAGTRVPPSGTGSRTASAAAGRGHML